MRVPRSASIASGSSLASLALLAAALAGCFSDRGVAIEVDVGTTGASTIELFLGAQACDRKDTTAGIACTTIAPPPDGSVPLGGNIWFRDAPAPYTAEANGRTATFQIRAEAPRTLPIVVAVGFVRDAQSPQGLRPVATATVRNLTIPVDNARVITTALVPAGPVQLAPDDTRNLTDDRVKVWPKKAPQSSCVVVEHWDHGQLQRDFVVPEDDPDCDDVPAPECNPAAYHGMNTVGGGAFRPDCFAPGTSACVTGELGCSDDVPGKNTTCVAEHDQVCVPGMFCGGPCNRFDESCLRTLAASDIPRIDCDVPTLSPVLNLCPGADQITPIQLDPHYQGGECDQQPLISALDLGGFGTSASFSGAVMELGSPMQPCHFNLQWKSGPRTIPDTLDYGLIRVAADKGALLIPIAFHFMPGACGVTPFKCSVTGPTADSLWSCAP
ncbi:MAG TPA: hypothetical protein VF469_15170 [Kofleriaceae bacterium]